ncbi:hypothetical protein G9A89_014854 [Geosiphon pyriformis]|nr:hypothetical protein G9A89_014854 [Geosiphon pyriformis]
MAIRVPFYIALAAVMLNLGYSLVHLHPMGEPWCSLLAAYSTVSLGLSTCLVGSIALITYLRGALQPTPAMVYIIGEIIDYDPPWVYILTGCCINLGGLGNAIQFVINEGLRDTFHKQYTSQTLSTDQDEGRGFNTNTNIPVLGKGRILLNQELKILQNENGWQELTELPDDNRGNHLELGTRMDGLKVENLELDS